MSAFGGEETAALGGRGSAMAMSGGTVASGTVVGVGERDLGGGGGFKMDDCSVAGLPFGSFCPVLKEVLVLGEIGGSTEAVGGSDC